MPPISNNNNNNKNIFINLLNFEESLVGQLKLKIKKEQIITKKIIYQPKGHPKQAIIDGEIWPPVFEIEAVRSAKTLKPIFSDVFVCTYPKCGTTWIQHICSQLLFSSEYGPQQGKVAELCITSPMIERVGADYCNKLNHPRLLKTHFSYNNCPKNDLSKYIFACRNPKDCLISYYHHNKNFKIYEWENGNFDQFFQLFIEGKLAFGDYFEHLKSWLPQLNNENVIFLKYEDMLKNLKETIILIAKFLNGNAAKLIENEQILEKIIRESQLESMQKDQQRWFPGNVLHNESFIRKGCARDWKNYLSKEQSDLIDKLFKQKMKGTVAENWWKDEMKWEEEEEEEKSDEKEEKEEEEINNDSGMESDDDFCCFEDNNNNNKRRCSISSETTSCCSSSF
ncbi:Sulfotransfer_1 domain-containing protein [Meloidogyne graminicola]|uniref:Sulfotransfer_1 domain-containing protein n=1 Tax=Meloidogyne graminicola TaxID=189291 RepID=A0A8S9ZMW1_9BILA|nr:Sulfotransfer_1 domain-containing protein [Meloidogyne graminicola]